MTVQQRATATWAAWCVAVLTVPVMAQSPERRLHREIPGDLGLGEMPAGALTPPQSAQDLSRLAGRGRYDEAARPGEDLLRPRDNWTSAARELDRETHSRPGEELSYQEVFNPSIAPFKRTHAYDAVDDAGRLVVRDPSLRPVAVGATPSWGSLPSARFTGDVFIELSPQSPTPIPSVAGEQRIVSYRTVPETALGFFEDSAGNVFVRSPVTQSIRVRLAYVVEAPQRAFTVTHIPDVSLSTDQAHLGMPAPLVPEFLRTGVTEVLQRVGFGATALMPVGVSMLAGYFRAFRDGDLPSNLDGQLYRALALGGVGACRHRAYAFALTLHAVGVNARFVGNEAHAWAEVQVPGAGWSRVDLGGWDVPLRTESPTEREAFVPELSDPLPRPAGYGEMYSSGTAPPTRGRHSHTSDAGTPTADPMAQGTGDAATGTPGDDPTATSVATGPAAANGAGRTGTGGSGAGDAGPICVPGGTGVGPCVGGVQAAAATGAGPGEALRDDPSTSEPEVARLGTTLRVTAVRGADGSVAVSPFVRGTMVEVTGEAQDETGAAAANLPVTFELWRNGRVVQLERGAEAATSLGTSVTGEDGRFVARVLLPMRLEWGSYELRARTSGDARRLSARSD